MKDKLSKEKRSELMSKIRSSNTKFEKDFIEVLKRRTKMKFSTQVKEIRGTPDIVFFQRNLCIFLDSDFWHGWQFPRWKMSLKDDFWRNKIEKNRKRDKLTIKYLRRKGWRVVRLWEHLIEKDIDQAIDKIKKYL